MNDISIVFQSLISALTGFSRYQLFRYYIFSGLIGVVLMILIVVLSFMIGDDLGIFLLDKIPYLGDKSPLANSWIGRILTMIMGFVLFKYVLLVALGPLMSKLSESIEKKDNISLTKNQSNSTFVSGIIRGLRLNMRNLFFELIITIPLIIASLIPGVAIITTPLLFLVQAYYVGFGLIDFYLERKLNVGKSITYVKKHKVFTLALGSVSLAILLIPFIGILISPTFSTTAGTLGLMKLDKDSQEIK